MALRLNVAVLITLGKTQPRETVSLVKAKPNVVPFVGSIISDEMYRYVN